MGGKEKEQIEESKGVRGELNRKENLINLILISFQWQRAKIPEFYY